VSPSTFYDCPPLNITQNVTPTTTELRVKPTMAALPWCPCAFPCYYPWLDTLNIVWYIQALLVSDTEVADTSSHRLARPNALSCTAKHWHLVGRQMG
jgi:hypothetical protein